VSRALAAARYLIIIRQVLKRSKLMRETKEINENNPRLTRLKKKV